MKVENAFGILSQTFGIYQRAMCMDLSNIEEAVLATIALHNFRRRTNSTIDTDSSEIQQRNFVNLNQSETSDQESDEIQIDGNIVREKLMNYISNLEN